MGVVVIGGNSFDVYGTQADAIVYLTGSFSPAATAWLALTPDQQKQTLVASTRMLDSMAWAGQPTQPYPDPQTLKWPRSGVSRTDGSPVDDATVPPEIEHGSYELAALLAAQPAIQDQQDASQNVRSLQAGSASIEYFRPVTGGRFPVPVQALVGQFLAGTLADVDANSPGAYSQAFGTSEPSQFLTGDGFDLNRSY